MEVDAWAGSVAHANPGVDGLIRGQLRDEADKLAALGEEDMATGEDAHADHRA